LTLQLLLADDQAMVRSGFRLILQTQEIAAELW
jgi:DNA-binding NarL/FixJ family response regulator